MSTYDNPFFNDNVYGHAVELLRRHTGGAIGIHLDIGCNVAHIAEPIRDSLGRSYFGFDIDDQALRDLKSRGFDAFLLDLNDAEAAREAIERAVGSQSVASISILDTLEHLPEPQKVLGMLREIADKHCATLVVSVPNVAHRDIGFKLAFGLWDYTDVGLLDHTHLRGFNHSGLISMMRSTGWHNIANHDVRRATSDQYFPALHPALGTATPLHAYLKSMRDAVDDYAITNQFVGAYLPGARSVEPLYGPPPAATEPFLSVITRTQGKRLDTLRDVLLCLSAQTCQDFEVCIIGHKLPDAARLAVERVIEDTNVELRHRIRLIRVDEGNRTRPLNVGFEEARGQYVAILDDDDIVLGHWVEEFKTAARAKPGRIVRGNSVAQLWQPVTTQTGTTSVRAVGPIKATYAKKFDFLEHLVENDTPPVSLAFPRAAFSDMRIHFDESMTTTEDWDFFMRTATVCGVVDVADITSIYRQWDSAESSFTLHSSEEWLANHHAIWRKLDAAPLLLEPGNATRIRQLMTDWNYRHHGKRGPLPEPTLEGTRYENALREDIYRLLQSRTWRAAGAIRLLGRLAGRRYPHPMLWAMTGPQLQAYKDSIVKSRSWRLVQKLKFMAGGR